MMTTSYIDIKRLFEQRKNNPLFNTSYPLSPDDWTEYSTPGPLPFDSNKPIAFYIHIPFCKQICSFCEYTKMCVPSRDVQINYLEALVQEIEDFIERYPLTKIYGLDVGGGTPTSLHIGLFSSLMLRLHDVIDRLQITQDFEPSIEGSFETLVSDYWGADRSYYIAKAGIKRLSLGIQTTSEVVLEPMHRNVISTKSMKNAIEKWHRQGISKINLDLMYGLPGQTIDTIRHDIAVIGELNPEQVTVYEFRTNQLKTGYRIDQEVCFAQYCELFDGLTRLGFYGEFGRNTFSCDPDDCGLSSYLRHRMYDGWQYKGFGISAQSMSCYGVSYNRGKNRSIGKMVDKTWLLNHNNSYESENYYQLPHHELLSKFIAISGYSGGFSISAAKDLYGTGFDSEYGHVIDFLLAEDLVKIKEGRLQLTPKGFRYYGSILSLFYKTDANT